MHHRDLIVRRLCALTTAALTCACVQSRGGTGQHGYVAPRTIDASAGTYDATSTTTGAGAVAEDAKATGPNNIDGDRTSAKPHDGHTTTADGGALNDSGDGAGANGDKTPIDAGSTVLTDSGSSSGAAGENDAAAVNTKGCTGFGNKALNWSVPAPVFDTFAWYMSPWIWTVMDMNGDGKVELVHTEDPQHKGHPFGTKTKPVWHIHANTGSGFAATATPWSLPSDMFHAPFFSQLQLNWSTLDLNHDGKPDLVQTEDPQNKGHAFGGTTNPHWRLHANTGNGFAKVATKWTVPAPVFDALAASYTQINWSTLDLDGDTWLDLVQTEDPQHKGHAFGVKQGQPPYWRVYRGKAGGFAKNAVKWAVPSGGFDSIAFAQSAMTWVTMDMTADGKPDLVQTEDPQNKGHAFGAKTAPHWRMYVNTGNGFATQPQPWAVPGAVFDITSIATGKYTWTTSDLNADGWPDLVHSENPDKPGHCFGGPANPHWRVHQGSAGGFAKTPVKWAVANEAHDAMWWFGQDDAWGTFDLDANGCVDFVQTRDPKSKAKAFGGESSPHWRVMHSL